MNPIQEKLEALRKLEGKRPMWENVLEEVERIPMSPVIQMTEKQLLAERNRLEAMLTNEELTYDLAGRLYEVRKYLKRIESLRGKKPK